MRYIDPHNSQALIDPANEAYWMGPRPEAGNTSGGTDLYIGGVEHAVLHLLYSRFWHKVLFDLGFVSSSEPYHKLFNQGYVQAYAYKDGRGQYVPADEVEEEEEGNFTWHGEPVKREYGKMGKSLKNIVTPDDMYEAYGADTFRVYEMSMAPLDMDRPWETRAVVGSQRFLQRLWRNAIDEVTGELVIREPFPTVSDAALLKADAVTCVIQVAGKVRDKLEVDPDIDPAELERLALQAPGVKRTLGDSEIRKVIVRAPKLVSIVPAK